MKKKNLLEKLAKAEDELTEEETPTENPLEKSFNDALSDLEEVNKSDPEKDEVEEEEVVEEDEEEEEVEEEEVEEEEAEEEEVEKSISTYLDENSEVAEAMNIEPFLKSFVDVLDKKLSAISVAQNKLQKSMSDFAEVQSATANLLVVSSKRENEMLKSLDFSANTPVERKGNLTLQKRFDAPVEVMNKAEIDHKIDVLSKAGRIDGTKVAILDSRNQKGIEMPAWFTEMKIEA